MQFTNGGPAVPNSLLQAHEEGRVIFFSGAGISYNVGLPGFEQLVKNLISSLGYTPSDIIESALTQKKYDTAIDLLETTHAGGRPAVRTALWKALQPDFSQPDALNTHRSLLTLARLSKTQCRLVTTNFDLAFEEVMKRDGLSVERDMAPFLPVPKASRWHSLVYLHGRLPQLSTDFEGLNRLVISSADFGTAYLTERWAARFVSELFRNYQICFVGYSIDDPVLRYMLDALAADRRSGEQVNPAYAFVPYEPSHLEEQELIWRSKQVTPIMYQTQADGRYHSKLHETLLAWAKLHSEGSMGKKRIVSTYAASMPTRSTTDDDFESRLMWALTDRSGEAASFFARFEPLPPLDWLKVFSRIQFKEEDLPRFGVHAYPGNSLPDYSLISRPAPYRNAIFGLFRSECRWDNITSSIAHWLLRHLGNVDLLLYFDKSPPLAPQLRYLLSERLADIDKHLAARDQKWIDDQRQISPNAIPGAKLRSYWRLLLKKSSPLDDSVQRWDRWLESLKYLGLVQSVRVGFLRLLEPDPKFVKSLVWYSDSELPSHDEDSIYCDFEIPYYIRNQVVAGGYDPAFKVALPGLVPELETLIDTTLGLMEEIHETNGDDNSFWTLPSIEDHFQNYVHDHWTFLIELLRDAWLAIQKDSPERAAVIGQRWFEKKFATYKRCAMFAAAKEERILSKSWFTWLMVENCRWLWSNSTRREVCRLLATNASKLESNDLAVLLDEILKGPPREDYRAELLDEEWHGIKGRAIWIRLTKVKEGGAALTVDASTTLEQLSALHHLRTTEHQREEFLSWSSGTGSPDYEPEPKEIAENNWKLLCREEASQAIDQLSQHYDDSDLLAARWNWALEVWSQLDLPEEQSVQIAESLLSLPPPVTEEIAYYASWWLRFISQKLKPASALESKCLSLAENILESHKPDAKHETDLLTWSINHTVGHITNMLLNLWYSRKPKDNQGLEPIVAIPLTMIADNSSDEFLPGKIHLAQSTIFLYRADADWTRKHLLPLFDWQHNHHQALAAWTGFVWANRLDIKLLTELKVGYLKTAEFTQDLGRYAANYISGLTVIALDPPTGFEIAEIGAAFRHLNNQHWSDVAHTLYNMTEGAGSQAGTYWLHKVKPFWKDYWPKDEKAKSDRTGVMLALLCVAARDQFPDAVDTLMPWMNTIEHAHSIIHLLAKTELPATHSSTTVNFLYALLKGVDYAPYQLKELLDKIQTQSLNEPQQAKLQQLLRLPGMS
jgi:hypothetical protein